MFNDPFDMKGMREEQNRWREQAQQTLVPGIDHADLKVSMRVTISPNLHTGDRSYTDCVHQIVASNASHVQTRMERSYGGDRLVMLMVHEHYFYLADGFILPEAEG